MTDPKQKISTLVRDLHMTIVRTQPDLPTKDAVSALLTLSTVTCVKSGLSRDEVLELAGAAYDHVHAQMERRKN